MLQITLFERKEVGPIIQYKVVVGVVAKRRFIGFVALFAPFAGLVLLLCLVGLLVIDIANLPPNYAA